MALGVGLFSPAPGRAFSPVPAARQSTSIADTDPEAERVQLELLRRATPERRLRLTLSLTKSVLDLSRRCIAARMPGASDEEIGLRFVALHYGPSLADAVRDYLLARR